MSKEQRTTLRKLALAATQGPWVHEFNGSWGVYREHGTIIVDGDSDPRCERDVEYIAAAHPRAVLDLLDEIDNGTCHRHADQKHGAEAEELRRGIEHLIKTLESSAGYHGFRAELQKLIDTVDARDSLAYLEAHDEQMATLRAALDEALDGWRSLTNRAGIPGKMERECITRIAALRMLVSGNGPTAIEYLRNEIRELKCRVEERDREIARLRAENERQERMIASFQEASTFHGGPG